MSQNRRSMTVRQRPERPERPQFAGPDDKAGVDRPGPCRTSEAGEASEILDEILRETRRDARRSRQEMIAARDQVHLSEVRIRELEVQLAQLRDAAREDELTGSLNRRGLNDVIERELARSARCTSPLSVAMLDLECFKKLDDAHGSGAADRAVIHLVTVAKNTLRMMDVVGRFGDDELLILLPDTNMENAMCTVARLQGELARQICMHEQKRLPISFSAGVASRHANEDPALLIDRADAARLRARQAGVNQAVAAD
ncbi:hypothetical protein BH11PSE11_BH11PSE11_30350 [soil metagenome]